MLNAEEFLLVRKKNLFLEVKKVIQSINAEDFKNKISKESSMIGRKLYAPAELNKEFKIKLKKLNWAKDKELNFDFIKDKVSLEVQFGKYAFIAHDITFKHSRAFVSGKSEVGIEIIPSHSMAKDMSSGVSNFTSVVKIMKELKGIICAPILIIGISPYIRKVKHIIPPT